MRNIFGTAAIISTLILAGCGGNSWWGSDDSKPPLPGDRISLLELQRKITPSEEAMQEPFSVPAPWKNDYWPQAGGYPNHVMQHLQIDGSGQNEVWRASIGFGRTGRAPMTAQPIVVDGKIFTMDTKGIVSAFNIINGEEEWSIAAPRPEKDDVFIIGGGLAYGAGQIFLTAGYNEIISISPADGKVNWRTQLPAPVRAAPTATENRVFVTTLDNRLLALSPADGKITWDYTGLAGGTSVIGAASPAVSRDVVIPAFSSGEITALNIQNGMPAWTQNLGATRALGGVSTLSDINGLPVIDQGLVIAIGFGGNLSAIDERTGEIVWQHDIGGSDTPWVAGDYVYVISAENEVIALNRVNGNIRWVTPLPGFKNETERKKPIYWTGPVLAGGKLIAVSSNRQVAEISPEDGRIVHAWETAAPVSVSPVVASGMLFILHDSGLLSAYK